MSVDGIPSDSVAKVNTGLQNGGHIDIASKQCQIACHHAEKMGTIWRPPAPISISMEREPAKYAPCTFDLSERTLKNRLRYRGYHIFNHCQWRPWDSVHRLYKN